MEPFVRHFIRSSLSWLGVGVLLGLWMALDARAVIYRPAHMHANLLGFVSMMIFGVAYHVLPRFSGAALRSRRTASVHVWVANVGLALMVGGWMTRATLPGLSRAALVGGGVLSAAGAFLFIGNIWLTLDDAGRRPSLMAAPARAVRP
ncbi:MAG TPA: cbb3-type cytochrome c oxidase subunit I [Longimicrobiales bacterium]|nr:cbb3-type cytochrome c oxidase subunit I [Longimicrobiales bacterium]